jgi:hypothetical protein
VRREDALLTLREAAQVLGMPYRRVRGWADAGALATLRLKHHGQRLVLGAELLRLERLGVPVAWDAIPHGNFGNFGNFPDARERRDTVES